MSTVRKSPSKKLSSSPKTTKKSSSKGQIQQSSTSLLSPTKAKTTRQKKNNNISINCSTSSIQDMNGSMSNLISIQNVQFVSNQAEQGAGEKLIKRLKSNFKIKNL